MYDLNYLAPVGSVGTGNFPASPSTGFQAESGGYDTLVFQLVVENVGATPTMTFKFQGSPDGTNWYDVGYVTDASDTISQAATTVTTTGAHVFFLSNPLARRYKYFRLNVSANTNVTFRGELYRVG